MLQTHTGGEGLKIDMTPHNVFNFFLPRLKSESEWISVKDIKPIATESGNWDGKRSELFS